VTHLRRDPATGHYELVGDEPVAKSALEPEPLPVEVVKETAEQRYLLCVAWEPGKQDRIAKGVDGARDFMNEAEVEQAAWRLIAKHRGGVAGVAHASYFNPGLEDEHAVVVESYVYRGPDWALTNTGGEDVVIKSGTWLVGLQCDDYAWGLYKTGRVTGVSTQGAAKRRTVRSTT
jgi:hypothetical protein